jgi:hypothetical protein
VASFAGALALAGGVRAESRTHDGLYLSFNAGVGYVGASGDLKLNKLSGLSTPVALWAGHNVGKKVVIGGGAFLDTVWSPHYKYDGDFQVESEDDGFALFGAAAFADIYPDPKGGLHIMPSIGWGLLFAPVSLGSGSGIVLGVGVGYDFWVASEFSLGVMGRFAYSPMNVYGTGSRMETYPMFAPALMLTATYH